jgi:integrase
MDMAWDKLEGGRMRLHNRLNTMKVMKAKRPGMYADGGSLYLRIAPGGSKQWVFRYSIGGRLRDMGFGSIHTLSLAEAREKARDARKQLLEGIDPIEAKQARTAALRAADAKAMTFRQCAEQFMRDHASEWTNRKHAFEWRSTLERYAYAAIGGLPVQAIDTPLVLKVVKPLWERVPTTAKRVLGRIENVLGWATVHHYRSGDNPARWTGHLEHALPTVTKGEHHAALPYAEAGSFMAKVRADIGIGARCLEFIILTAARMGEATNATWDEIDLESKVWTIPAGRMKAGKEHKVPLSNAAIAVIEQMAAIRQSAYVFPGRLIGKPLTENSVWRLAKAAADDEGVTVHGFRSTFRDWAAEQTSYPNHVVEQALAHTIPNAVEAAYRRGDLFEKRRRLMDVWARYLSGRSPSVRVHNASKVVSIR